MIEGRLNCAYSVAIRRPVIPVQVELRQVDTESSKNEGKNLQTGSSG